ncbi:MAG: hypothetical protein AAGJ80_12615 [Cyanobacteria bacterium J06553_1]
MQNGCHSPADQVGDRTSDGELIGRASSPTLSLMGRWDWGQKGTQSANIFLEPKLHFGCLNGWHPKCKTGATEETEHQNAIWVPLASEPKCNLGSTTSGPNCDRTPDGDSYGGVERARLNV